MRPLTLTTIRGGINRLRPRGGARPDVLYDLVNGYVTEVGTIKSRPGTERVATLPSETRGLCAFQGVLHTFCHKFVAVPEGYKLSILQHPDPELDEYGYYFDAPEENPNGVLEKIHFSEPFLGGLYVVAEFADGQVFHYWLRPGSTWQANTVYGQDTFVEPTVPNGILYQATRLGDPLPTWQKDEPRYDATDPYEPQSEIEPTVYNGYYYRCIDVAGPNPRSGTTEPEWPTVEGYTITERTDTGLPEETTLDNAAPPPAGSTTTTTTSAPAGGGGGTKYDYNVVLK